MDIEHLAEEIESIGKSERRALISQLARLLMHLLNWGHQPERRSRNWRAQANVARLLEDNPSLLPTVPELMTKAYEDARRAAAIETDMEPEVFPEACMYGFDEAMAFVPEEY